MTTKLWDKFYTTGKVADYLQYCSKVSELKEKEQGRIEVFDRRTCDKRK